MKRSKRPLLHMYLADHQLASTSSKGIWNVSRCLLAALVKRPDQGFDMCVSVNPSDRHQILPEELPEWVRVVEVKGPRLWLDHVWCPWASFKMRADAVYFPKGWLPFVMLGKAKTIAFLHDCMNDFYAKEYPDFFSVFKTLYFRLLTRHAYKHADKVCVNSKFTASELRKYVNHVRDVSVLPLGNPLEKTEPDDEIRPRKGLLVLGSTLPHKHTRETMSLLGNWCKDSGFSEPIYLAGSWVPDDKIICEYLGRISDQELLQKYKEVRAFVTLSTMEGFGLPLLEAYAHGTPVLFRDAHAFHEVMGEDAPGAWDGDPESFDSTITRVLNLKQDDIQAQADKLFSKYSWEKVADVFLQGIGDLLK